uniref:uncharacterized protein LOC122596145 isoform X1 n=1 Tax=Erigeron canadensis TaxID=72917 RepID=UPI001CB9285F|nr:uncharacterized protein LOC122596145 isoform X1 [Erigeron canadensis]
MALISGSVTSFTGLNISKPLLPSPKLTANTLVNYPKTHVCFEKTSVTRPLYFVRGGYGAKYVLSAGSRNYEPSSHYDGNRPFWLAPSQEFMRALKSVFVFLAEQPSQLKYIEWPGFQNTHDNHDDYIQKAWDTGSSLCCCIKRREFHSRYVFVTYLHRDFSMAPSCTSVCYSLCVIVLNFNK